jgi:hypothetical protein
VIRQKVTEKMLRRLSKSVGGSKREAKKEKKMKEIEFWENQKKLSKEMTELSESMVKYKTVPDLVPATRNGTQLFQVKSSGAETSGQDLDRTLYEMPMPENVDAMTDLIKLHKDGDKFPYVGIVGSEGETLDARRARMLSLKPSLGLRSIPEIEVTGCPLIDTEGEFSMSTLMQYAISLEQPVSTHEGIMPSTASKKNYTVTKQYVHIKSVTGLYTPNMSSTADFCKLWFVLIDNRLINQGKSGQSNALVSNQEGVMEMSCDYCVSYSDLSNFVLGYTLEREILKPGFQWGTISFYFNITESDIPYQSAKRDALTVYRMPISTLTKRETNADKSDISFTARDVNALRELYLKGDIVDVDEPQKARLKKSSYSKSTLRGVSKGEEITSSSRQGWEFMSGSRKPQVDAKEASVTVEEEEEEEENIVNPITKANWLAHQEKLRDMQKGEGKELANSGDDEESDDEPDIMKRVRLAKSLNKGKGKEVAFKIEDV